MAKQSKRKQAALASVDRERAYPLAEAVALVKANAAASKFDETIEVAMNLGVDPRHADQMVRGVVAMPNGTGKTMRVAVFARDAKGDAWRLLRSGDSNAPYVTENAKTTYPWGYRPQYLEKWAETHGGQRYPAGASYEWLSAFRGANLDRQREASVSAQK